ncbi:WXG100 family type VII secretion target [Mycobacteroides chelonae]|nr:WXG100 family type VII secretion target [Mycobacteroides chelonae]
MVELLESGWKGAGADACHAAWSEWNKGFRLMINGLADEAQALRLAASSYRSTDGGSAARFNDSGTQL